jgi:hypothetical protein
MRVRSSNPDLLVHKPPVLQEQTELTFRDGKSCILIADGRRLFGRRPWTRGFIPYLVIALAGFDGSVVDLLVVVPPLSVVDVAWSGVGSVFTPGTPVVPP